MLKHRSYQKELLDNDAIPFEDIKQNLKELNVINKWLGGHAITIEGIKKIAGDNKTISICEIGCGGGDNLLAIERYSLKNGIQLNITGIDIKAECIEFAQQRKLKAAVRWETNDYKLVQFKTKPDIIFSSLFCHHFTDEELVFQLEWMKENSRLGFFINDLERNIIAYHSIKLLTRVFSSSYLVKNDAPISVSRGFTKDELLDLCRKANVAASVYWKWAFRFLVVYKHHSSEV